MDVHHDAGSDSLALGGGLKLVAVVHPAHVLHQQVQPVLRAEEQLQLLAGIVLVLGSLKHAVEVILYPVRGLDRLHLHFPVVALYLGAVQHVAVAVSRLLHGHGVSASPALRQIVQTGEQGHLPGQLRPSVGRPLMRPGFPGGNLREQLADHLPDLIELLRWLPPLGQDGVVVVGSDLGQVGVAPGGAAVVKSEVGSALEHIEVDAGPL